MLFSALYYCLRMQSPLSLLPIVLTSFGNLFYVHDSSRVAKEPDAYL